MNPEEMLNQISTIISDRPESVSKKYALYHDEGEFHCEPVKTHPDNAILIGVFNVADLKKGFTNSQWSKVMHKCAKILKEKST